MNAHKVFSDCKVENQSGTWDFGKELLLRSLKTTQENLRVAADNRVEISPVVNRKECAFLTLS